MMIFFLLLIAWSCDDDFAYQDNTPTHPPIPYEWRYPLMPDTIELTPVDPYFFDGTVFFGAHLFLEDIGNAGALTAESGKLLWLNDCDISASLYSTAGFANYAVMHCHNTIEAIDIYNGNSVWTNNEISGLQFSKFGDEVYAGDEFTTADGDVNSILGTKFQTGNWDTIFSLHISDDYDNDLLPPAVTINNEGDTLIIFQNRKWNFYSGDGELDLYCYNISADSIVWLNPDFDDVGVSGVHPPEIYDGKVFFMSSWTLYCFDLLNGQLIWKHTFGMTTDDNLFSGFIEYFDGDILIKTGGDWLYSFDENTGSSNWEKNLKGYSPSDGTIYNGHIYYTASGYIYVVDAETGLTTAKFTSPAQSIFINRIAIDPVNNYMYATDLYYIYCYKIDW